MTNNLSYEGRWWIPDIETPISGSLEIKPDDGADLNLVGSFRSIKEIFEGSGLQADIILGELSNGKKVTLYECYVTKQEVNTPGFPIESYLVNFVFFGGHFMSAEDIRFNKIMANYSHLDSWANISGFDIQHLSEEGIFKINYKLPKPIEANIDKNKIIINFEHEGPTWSIVQNEVHIKQKTFIILQFSDGKSLDECIAFIYLIKNFLSLGVGKPVKQLKIKGIVESNEWTNEDNAYMEPVEIVYGTKEGSYEHDTVIPQEMVFSFGDISDKFQDRINNWIEKADLLEPVYNLYFGTLYNPHMYLEHRFLSLIQALESYHRRIIRSSQLPEVEHKQRIDLILESSPEEYKKWLNGILKYSNEPPLRTRLMEIIERYPKIKESKRNRDIFLNETVMIRNHLTHYSHSEDKTIKMILNDRHKFYEIIQKLKYLIELCFLTELGFDENEIKNMRPYKNLMK